VSEARPRILLIRLSSLGDIIHGLPALVALRRAWPEAYLAWLVEDRFADLLRGHDCLDEIITIRRPSAREGLAWWREARRVGRQLRERRFDLAVDLQGRVKSAWLCALSGAPRRVGFANEFRGPVGLRWINESVPFPPGTHAVRRSLLMAEYLGAASEPVEFRFPVLPEARAWAEEFLRGAGILPSAPEACVEASTRTRPLVALILGASTPVKTWPPQYFARLIEVLREAAGAETVLLGGSGEADREAQVQAALGVSPVSAVGQTDLPRLAALLERAQVVVGADTGSLHLAAALDKPVVGLYGPTSPELTGPYGPQHRILWDRPACGSCGRRPTCADRDCMRALTPERVAQAVCELLTAAPPAPAHRQGSS